MPDGGHPPLLAIAQSRDQPEDFFSSGHPLHSLGIKFMIRMKAGTNVHFEGRWCRLGKIKFQGNQHHCHLGSLLYCESSPQRLWVCKSRARDTRGNWRIWRLVSHHPYNAKAEVEEYGRCFSCEEGLRDAK
jgi:hypothetical protein